MRKSRSIIALITALAFVLSFSLVAAAAPQFGTEAFSDVDENSAAADAFALLKSLDIFEGYGDGTVGPNDTLTREQFAAVVIRAMGQANTAQLLDNTTTAFTDDASITWSRGVVVLAVANGIINGYPEGDFRPQNNVTFAEAFAMLTRALGIDGAATGPWPANYIALAGRIGLNDGLSPQANVAMTRSEMAIATQNAMDASWTWDADKKKLTEDDKDTDDNSWFTAAHSTGEGDLEATGSTWIQVKLSKKMGKDKAGVSKKFDLADNVLVFGADNADGLLGKAVKFTLVNGKLAYLATKEDVTVTVTEGLITKLDDTTIDGKIRLTLNRGEIVTLDDDADVEIDGDETKKANNLEKGQYVRVRVKDKKATVTAFTFDTPVVVGYDETTSDGAGKISLSDVPRTKSSITVWEEDGAAWKKLGTKDWTWVSGEDEITGLQNNTDYIVSYDPDLRENDDYDDVESVLGATTSLTGVKAGDVVYINDTEEAIYVVRDTVTGKVSKVEQLKDEDRITVDGRALYAEEDDYDTDDEGHFRVGLADNVIGLQTSVTLVETGVYGVQRSAYAEGSKKYITLEAFGETKAVVVDDNDRGLNGEYVKAVPNGEVTINWAAEEDAEVMSISGDVMQLSVDGDSKIINTASTPIFTRDSSDDNKLASGSYSGIKVGDEFTVVMNGNKVVIVIIEK